MKTSLASVLRRGLEHEKVGNFPAAIDCWNRALESEPRSVEALGHLGRVWFHLEEPKQAETYLRRALELAPESPSILALLGQVLIETGHFEPAREVLEHALKLSVGKPLSWARIAFALANLRDSASDASLIQEIRGRLAHGAHPVGKKYLSYALGRLLDRAGQHAEAFTHWLDGARLKRREVEFDLDQVDRLFAELESVLTSEFLDTSAHGGCPSARPVFIVGMPRSGSTLVEQILSSHPRIHGGGELETLGRLVEDLPARLGRGKTYGECLRALDGPIRRRLGKDIDHALREIAPEARRVCDKAPQNFIHLGLIALILPRARVVHCRRHPLDTCLSCFSTLFSGASQPFTYDFSELAGYYRLYDRLMTHWLEVLPLAIHEIDYESLVTEQEQATRELLSFCDVPWDARCLHFHRQDRAVHTASQVQVRQPLYDRSIARWRHYEAQLAHCRRLLPELRQSAQCALETPPRSR